MIIDCQYCFNKYEFCTCCKYCSFPKDTCECHLEGEYPCTKLHPSDVYRAFCFNPNLCEDFGYYTLEDIDNHVKKSYISEVWPERLKQEL